MTQTIKPGDCNYYLMSNNNCINIENPQISTEDTPDKLIIQVINVSRNLKQNEQIKAIKPKTINILKGPTKIKSHISVEFYQFNKEFNK
jgi:3-methyladenine DNA glycosylase Mpg